MVSQMVRGRGRMVSQMVRGRGRMVSQMVRGRGRMVSQMVRGCGRMVSQMVRGCGRMVSQMVRGCDGADVHNIPQSVTQKNPVAGSPARPKNQLKLRLHSNACLPKRCAVQQDRSLAPAC